MCLYDTFRIRFPMVNMQKVFYSCNIIIVSELLLTTIDCMHGSISKLFHTVSSIRRLLAEKLS